mgnify:CR=1 FL=1
MSRLLPFKSEATSTPDEPRVLDLDDEATDAALSALSSETARNVLAAVYEEPRTPPEIRDEVGTSLQNVHYHIEQLSEADLIEEAGTGYSEKGTEMTVYGPANEAFVLFAGKEHDRSRLKAALSRLLGSVGLLALASYAVQRFVESTGTNVGRLGDQVLPGTDTAGPGGANATETPTETDVGAFHDTVTATPQGTAGPTGQSTAAPTASPQPTPSPVSTETPTPIQSGTPDPSTTPMPTETPTATPTAMPTETPTETPTATPTRTPTETPTATPTDAPATTPIPDSGATETVRQAADGGSDALLADPGIAFFVGGAFMLCVMAAWWYTQS